MDDESTIKNTHTEKRKHYFVPMPSSFVCIYTPVGNSKNNLTTTYSYCGSEIFVLYGAKHKFKRDTMHNYVNFFSYFLTFMYEHFIRHKGCESGRTRKVEKSKFQYQ